MKSTTLNYIIAAIMRAFVITFMTIIFWLRAESAAEDDFSACLVARHNYYRALHNVDPVTNNKTMCQISQEWANLLIDHGTFEHSGNRLFGENLYMAWFSDNNTKLSGNVPVDGWYSEIKLYPDDYNTELPPANISSVGHYTQLVWSKCQCIGVGVAKKYSDGGMKWVVVTNYYPPGNMIGKFKNNVFPPKKASG